MASDERPAAGETASAFTQRLVAMIRDQEDVHAILGAELETELTPTQWRKVEAFAEEAADRRASDADEMYDEWVGQLARHFPSLEVAIRVVWEHVFSQDRPGEDCCFAATPEASE